MRAEEVRERVLALQAIHEAAVVPPPEGERRHESQRRQYDALLRAQLDAFRRAGVARVQAFAMHAALQASLRRRGFMPGRSPMQFCVRARVDDAPLRDLGRWHVVFGDSEGYLHFLAAATGEPQLRLSTDGKAVVGTPLLVGRTMIVTTAGGGVHAFQAN